MERDNNQKPLTISEYIKNLNKDFEANVIGETGGINISTKGHTYFTLNDSKSVIKRDNI